MTVAGNSTEIVASYLSVASTIDVPIAVHGTMVFTTVTKGFERKGVVGITVTMTEIRKNKWS